MQLEQMESLGLGVNVFTSNIHNFTTDTVILAYFASKYMPNISKLNILDLCSGCGTLSLLLSREDHPAHITAIEIQNSACKLLEKSINYNNFNKFISVINCDLNDFSKPELYNSFDAIVCNPPYKPLSTGILSDSYAKNLIKHEIACNLEDIARFSQKYLKDRGTLFLCARAERLTEVLVLMKKYKLEAKLLRFVHHAHGKDSKFFCVKLQKNANSFLKVLSPLIMSNDSHSADQSEIDQIYKYMLNNKIKKV